jgi:hypothetical protein
MLKKASPSGIATVPMMKKAAKINHTRLREDSPDDVLGNDPP